MKAANDAVDAVKAAEKFVERQLKGLPTILSDSEKRAREGKVIDAIWHVGIDQMKNTNKNAAELIPLRSRLELPPECLFLLI